MSGGGLKASSIPNSVRKTILTIKEITGNHSEDEIYAMLKECSMDPNETTQRLLLQDPFREVKRKRDRKKENLNSKEAAEPRWRSGTQGRGGRPSRGNYYPRHTAHEAGGAKSSGPGRDNGTNPVAQKASGQSSSTSQETKTKESTLVASPLPLMSNGPTGVVAETSFAPSTNAANQHGENLLLADNEFVSAPSPVDAINKTSIAFGSAYMSVQLVASSSECSMSITPSSSAAICFSSSDPVLVPSSDSWLPGTLGTIKREVGSQLGSTEPNALTPNGNKLASAATEITSSFMQGRVANKSSGVVKAPVNESCQPLSASTHGGSSVTRSSSNYSARSQHIVGPQKVGSNNEWKPKPVSSNAGQVSGTAGASEISTISREANAQSQPVSSGTDSEEATSKVQKKLEQLHLPQCQHVIIPNHIHVPESERTKLSFGSFDASFGVTVNYVGGQESDKSSTPLSETSQDADESAEQQASSNQNALTTVEEGDYSDHPQSPVHAPENLSVLVDVSSSVPEYNEQKQENTSLSGGHQYSVVHTSPNYSFGFVPPILAPLENTESQAREVPRLSSFVVQQPFDPAAYYAQFYRSSADSDGRVSPFPSAAVAAKYNGNVAILPSQTSQSPQEGANSLAPTTASPTPSATQAAGLMQSSIAVTQQPLPVYRAGVHLSHYPPNYIQYAPFYSPFLVPSPAIHQFINNSAFPHQPQAGTVFPSAPTVPTTGVKFSLTQFKPGTNTANSTHMGVPSGYGPYGSSPAGYNPSSAATTGNSTTNEDLGASQFKENNVYINGQQSEGSAVWIAPPGRDISNMPATSFYNLPQGQSVTFAPTQVAPGSFAGIYHPQAVTAAAVHPLIQQAQTMAGAVDMVGPAANVYQQSQHAQMNWPSNY